MSMKDLLSKMTELQGTTKETKEEKVTSTGKKLLNENTEVKESTKPSLKNIFNTMLNEAEKVDEKYMGFEKVKAAAKKGGAEDPGAVAASIGRKKYGKEKFQKAAAAGKKLGEAEQITIQPAKQNTQVIKQGQKTLGTVENPQLAQQIKQSIGKGEMSLAGDELNEKWGEETKVSPSEKGKYEGKTKEELLKQYNALKASGPHKEGSSEYGKMRELAFAIRAKSGWGKVDESKLNEKAVSKSQQQAAGIALAAKRGEMPKSKLKGASKEMEKMSTKELEKFAGTKHKGLPEKKQKTDEAAMPTHDGDFGAGLGAGRSETTLESSSMRLVKKEEQGNKSYKIYKDLEWGEFRVKFYENGKHLVDADYHTDDMQDAIGTAQRHLRTNTLEAKKTVKKDDKAEKAGKKVTKDIEYDEKVKDKIHGAKRKAEDEKAEKAGKKVAKDIEYDTKKKKVNESMNHNKLQAARLRGKAHALAKESYNCKYDEGTEERNAYHEGYKEGLDECYGMMPIQGLVVGEEMPATVPGMASAAMEADMDEGNAFTAALAKTPKGGRFSVGGKTFTDRTSYDAKVDEMDMMAFESWDRELNALLNEGKMKDIDIDMKEMSDAQFKKEHGKSKADMKKDLSASKDKKVVKEGISVSVSKGNQGTPDSVTVTAQDGEADQLLAMIKQAGLGLFGGDDAAQTSAYGAPVAPEADVTISQKSDVGDHDSMMALIKKMSTSPNDYEDEESQDDEHVHGHPDAACDTCGSSDCGCDDESDSKALVVGEDETEDQMEFEVAEDNAPDSDEAETTADENAEAKEDQALAGADSGDEEEINEGNKNSIEIGDEELERMAKSGAAKYFYFDDHDPEVVHIYDASKDEIGIYKLEIDMGDDPDDTYYYLESILTELPSEEELNEWANDAGYEGSENIKDNTFEQDIDFMTRVISGGLNGPKKDQTTLPHTKVKVAESDVISDWKKLSGIR